jgi:hypothetical protein
LKLLFDFIFKHSPQWLNGLGSPLGIETVSL